MNTIVLDFENPEASEVSEGMGEARGFSPDGSKLEVELFYDEIKKEEDLKVFVIMSRDGDGYHRLCRVCPTRTIAESLIRDYEAHDDEYDYHDISYSIVETTIEPEQTGKR